ncbi:hypothetical protein FND36_00400 [Lachnospiraceae bacterium KGMB03038]|nr:hypothetical protein FND36_00400 [Lachnospiraceae bacterium KGMB03038]
MNRKEQEILERIRTKTDQIKTPDSLRPEAVRQQLAERKIRESGTWRKAVLPVAACLVLAAGLAIYGNTQRSGDKSSGEASSTESAEVSRSKTIASAESYEEIYGYLKAQEKQTEMSEWSMEESADMVSNESAESAASESASAKASEYGGDYSGTNLRQQGVDEGDIVKTDGKFLYIVGNGGSEVVIVEAGEEMKETGRIQAEDGRCVEEIYLLPKEKKAVLICSFDSEDDYGIYPLESSDQEQTEVLTYDISAPSDPQLLGKVSQSGWYHSSRLVNGFLYLFSQYYVGADIRETEPESFIPAAGERLLEETDIFMPQYQAGNMYEVITAVDLENPDQTKDSKAIFTKGGELYVSENSIYYYEIEWDQKTNMEITALRKLSYESGVIEPEAQGTVNGYINDSFSIDEYKGNLRIVTTVEDTNSVYVLDEKLEIIGEIEGLAEDERIYSARFLGETGYFVTFRETDPLFSVDFSAPENPKIIGQLKIPGFSDYLHYYGDGKLLGIGMDVEEETQITGGVKLTMFDVSDPTDVKEADTYVLENVYSTEVSYDYKAALIDPGTNRIGFPADSEGGEAYYLFSYDEEQGFQCNLEEEINGGGGSARGVYIGERLYVIQGNVIEAYSLENYEKVGDLIL